MSCHWQAAIGMARFVSLISMGHLKMSTMLTGVPAVEVPGSGSSLDTERIALPVRVEPQRIPRALDRLKSSRVKSRLHSLSDYEHSTSPPPRVNSQETLWSLRGMLRGSFFLIVICFPF